MVNGMRSKAEASLTAGLGRRGGLLKALGLVAGANLLLVASAWVKVPMWPVPMTMQTLAVLLIGAACGATLAPAAVAATLAEAALGLPVLAGAASLAALGPTAGYLAGFLLAAAALGLAAERGAMRRTLPMLATLLAGEALIFLPGLAWLDIGFLHDARATLATGLFAFLPGEATKLALAAVIITAWRGARAPGR